jgi:RNA polymerase sigma-70 factor, ECF subfamily
MCTPGASINPLRCTFPASPAIQPKRFSPQMTDDTDPNQDTDQSFDSHGRWDKSAAPRVWHNPEDATGQRQFQEIVRTCLADLPPRLAEVFHLRDVLGESIEEICRTLQIAEGDCSERLFQARMRLRAGVEARLFTTLRAGH